MLSLKKLIVDALAADNFTDDITTSLLGEYQSVTARAMVRTREAGIFSGFAGFEILERLTSLKAQTEVVEGSRLEKGQTFGFLTGTIRDLLGVERTLLNILSHACGVATLTRKFVDAVNPYPTKILATRKTLPGLKDLQLQAVRAGGGFVHRRSLSDGILIKDNHQAILPAKQLLIEGQKQKSPLHRIEIEVQNLEILDEILALRPDIIMLDNMDLPTLQKAIQKINGKAEVEVSGGVNLSNVRAISELGVQYISVGQLTHSVPALDLTMDLEITK